MDGPWVQSAPSVSLKRKSMSLNADGVKDASSMHGPDGFRWEPVVAKTREEKNELRKRLKMQLEQVEGLSVKIVARQEQLLKGLDRGVRATHSDAHLSRTDNGGSGGKEVTSEPAAPVDTPRHTLSQREARLARQPSVVVSSERLQGTPGFAGKEKRTPKANQLYLNSEFVSGKDKMPPPEKLKSKTGAGAKRGAQGKASDARDAKRAKVESARSKRMSDIMKLCATLLKKLISHKYAWVFNEPVDAVRLGLHDYHKVIKKPMDLGTIKKKLEGGLYLAPTEFAEDVRLTFSNAMTYNPVGHDVYVMANGLRELFEDRWKNIEDKVDEDRLKVKAEEEALAAEGHGQSEQYNDLKQHLRSIEDKIQSLSKTSSRPGTGRPPAQPKPRPDDVEKRPMTFEEKRKLSVALENLPPDKLERIVQIIKKRNPNVSQNEDEIEVDIDAFDNDTLWELDRFVTNCAKSRGKAKKKVAPKEPPSRQEQEVAQAQDNGTGEAPKKARKGADAEEEDVDIDDDMAPTQCAPVVIEKDAGGASSSSSSSSSDSGSSSSDSDSATSSGSDSDADEPQNMEVNSKASPDAEAEIPKKDAVDEVAGATEEPLAGKVSSSGQQDEHREEGLPERQVSPEKLLRAALLRGRFADTILKAQEKTLPLNKNEKIDPEKLKRDREVLEKRQREEKARLHAEARAAEITRRKAEAEAAAEARRKREAEREAARMELQQMEKTVEIDENSEILKDLEMLRSQAVESSGEDASPDSESPDGVPIFALQGGNPLHQLGLFIKQDEEEEDDEHDKHSEGDPLEEVEKKEIENGVDVEEGEID